MKELCLSIGEPFISPAWGSNLVLFHSVDGSLIPEDMSKEYIRRACKYARHYEVYLVPERFLLMGYQCMCLISPEGKVLGAQKGLFLNQQTRIGKRSSGMEVLHTEFGGIFLCVDVDIYHPEVARIAANMGAQFILCSQSINMRDYNTNMVLTGVWNAAQACKVYTVAVTNEFNCVCAPLDLTEREDGFIVPPNLKLPLSAKLNSDSLLQAQQPYRLSRQLYALHRGELIHT